MRVLDRGRPHAAREAGPLARPVVSPSPRCCSRSPSRVYLGRFERLFSDATIFTGVTYTDAHVTLTGLLVVSVALALGAADRARQRRRRRRASAGSSASVVPAVVCYVLVVGLVGWYVNSFIVKPNELVRERPYIAHNIEMTRQAFGLDRIAQRPFPAEAGSRRVDAAQQPGDAREHPAVGLARAAGHAAADSGNPHLLRLSRHRHRPLRARRHGAADDARRRAS